jgi:hypothetical protein
VTARLDDAALERRIQRDIEIALGALPGVLVYANGTATIEKRAGGRTWREHTGLGEGTPDLVVLDRGRVVGLEVKSETGAPEDSQLRVQAQWHRTGAFYAFVRSVDDALAALSRAREGHVQ